MYNTNSYLSETQLRNLVPSAFAETAHDSRSARYTYIPTIEVILGLVKEGFMPVRAKQGGSRIAGKADFTKHMVTFRHQDHIDMRTGVDSFPEIILINSHDGTSSYKVMGGIFRTICTNGLIVAESMVGSVNVHHKGNIVDDVIEGSFQVIEDTATALEVTQDWQALQLSAPEQEIFAEAAHEIRFADANGEIDTPIRPEQLLTPQRRDDQGNDLWRTFNRVQENAIRGGLRGWQRDEAGRPVRRVSTREVKGIDQDVKLNRALFSLAEKMAELKAA